MQISALLVFAHYPSLLFLLSLLLRDFALCQMADMHRSAALLMGSIAMVSGINANSVAMPMMVSEQAGCISRGWLSNNFRQIT